MTAQPTVPVFDMQVYENSTLFLQFAFKLVDADGVEIGPYNLTGIDLEVSLRDILASDKVWLSTEATDADGSYVSITDAPGGLVNVNISSATLSSIRKMTGDWALRRVYGVNHKELMLVGTVVVNPILAGGNL